MRLGHGRRSIYDFAGAAMHLIGEKSRFAFEVGDYCDDSQTLRVCNIYVANKNLCCDDNHIYVPSFIASLIGEFNNLISRNNFLKYESDFKDRCIADIHRMLVDSEEYVDAAQYHAFMCWGETTDQVLSFLIPYDGCVYLTYEFWRADHQPHREIGQVCGVQVYPYHVMRTIEKTIDLLIDSYESTHGVRILFKSS